jgi:hypothetical protein
MELPPPKHERFDPLWAALLAVLCLLPALPYLLSGSTFLGAFPITQDENLNEWMIYRAIFDRALADGFPPLWSSQLACGFPFAGWPHTAIFAPLGLIYSLLAYPTAAVVSLYLHLAIFTVSTYALLRSLSQRPAAAFTASLAGIVFYLIVEGDHFLPRLLTYAWTPLLVFCWVGLWRTRRAAYFLGALALTGLQVLGGHPETLGREFMMLALLILSGLIVARHELWLHRRELGLILASALGGLCLALIQFLPALELTHFSTRSDPEWFPYSSFASVAGLHQPAYFLRVLFNPLSLAAALYAIAKMRKNPLIRVLALTALLATLLSANAFGILRLIYPLPILGSMMWHQLNLHFINLMVVVGMGVVLDEVVKKEDFRPILRWSGLATLIFSGATAMESHWLTISSYPYPLDAAAALQHLLLIPSLLLGASAIALSYRAQQHKQRPLAALMIILLLAGFCYWPSFNTYHRQSADRPRWDPAYEKFVAGLGDDDRIMTIAPPSDVDRSIPYQVGLSPHERGLDSFTTSTIRWYAEFYSLITPMIIPQPNGRTIRTNFWLLKNENYISDRNLRLLSLLNLKYVAIERANLKNADHYFLRLDPTLSGPERIHVPPDAELRLAISAPEPLALNILARPENDSRLRLIMSRSFSSADPRPYPLRASLAAWSGKTIDLTLRTLTLSAASSLSEASVLSRPVIYRPGAQFQRLDIDGIEIFRNTGVLPRAYIYPRPKLIEDKSARLSYLSSKRFDPFMEVVLEKSAPTPFYNGVQGGKVKIFAEHPGYLDLPVMALGDPVLLVLSDVYYPGWIAEVDGHERPILRANHAFRAVELPTGLHTVTMTFRPASVRIGLAAGEGGGVCGLMMLLIFAALRRARIRPGRN